MQNKGIYIRNEFGDEIHVIECKDFMYSRSTKQVTTKTIRSYRVYKPVEIFGGTLAFIKRQISLHRGVKKCTWTEYQE